MGIYKKGLGGEGMKTTNNELGKMLRELREEKRMSLREFSERLGISHAYLNKLEIGKDSRTGKEITPTIETLTKLAEGLGMSTKEFLTRCGYLKDEAEEDKGEADIELTNLTNEFITALLSSDHVKIQGRQVEQKEIENLVEAIRAGLKSIPE